MLTPRELTVVTLAAEGHSDKRIAYDLGVSKQTVATHLSRAREKLGLRNRLDLITLFVAPPSAVEAGPWWAASLSRSERDVVVAVLEGKSHRQIAIERGRSVRTVANQVGSVFRKLGISSRAELAVLAGRYGRPIAHGVLAAGGAVQRDPPPPLESGSRLHCARESGGYAFEDDGHDRQCAEGAQRSQ
jgi:DNA-binding NarL/FixJ family response regulator